MCCPGICASLAWQKRTWHDAMAASAKGALRGVMGRGGCGWNSPVLSLCIHFAKLCGGGGGTQTPICGTPCCAYSRGSVGGGARSGPSLGSLPLAAHSLQRFSSPLLGRPWTPAGKPGPTLGRHLGLSMGLRLTARQPGVPFPISLLLLSFFCSCNRKKGLLSLCLVLGRLK